MGMSLDGLGMTSIYLCHRSEAEASHFIMSFANHPQTLILVANLSLQYDKKEIKQQAGNEGIQ